MNAVYFDNETKKELFIKGCVFIPNKFDDDIIFQNKKYTVSRRIWEVEKNTIEIYLNEKQY